MVLHALRALFILLMAAVGWFFVKHNAQPFRQYTWLALTITLTLGVFFVCIDILAPRKKLAVFSGTILGLIVGLFVAYALSFVVDMIVDQYLQYLNKITGQFTDLRQREALILFADVVIGLICCYLAVSFIFQTKDDFRFIIPYVEFSKQVRGARPMLVDTSVIIDGRIVDVANTGIIDSRLIVPRFVLQELQAVADHSDKLKRARGRRGLDALGKLQNSRKIEVVIYEWTGHSHPEVAESGADEKLLALAKELNARVLSNDFNLSKVATVAGVELINLNELAGALRPNVLPGERMQVRLVKPGEEPSQGVGFLDDGTMVVIEGGRAHLNEEVDFAVTNVLQTASGKMIFGRLGAVVAPAAPEPVAQGPVAHAGPRRHRGRIEEPNAG
jgi:uncharacterized protein YacL